MINPFIIKKFAALLFAGFLPVIGFAIGIMILKDFIIAMAIMGVMMVFAVLIGVRFLANPFQLILEGQGVLALDMNSTGIIRPFVMRVKQPFVQGQIDTELASDVFDRDTVFNLAAPVAAGRVQQGEGKDGITRVALILSEEEYNKGRFGLFHFPCIVYNSQIRSIITKDWFAEKEKGAFAEHGILYLNRKLEDLTSITRDFARYIVESLNRQPFKMPSWGWIVIAGVFIIILIYFGPQLLGNLGNAGKAVAQAGGNAAGAITPLS